MIVLQRLCSGVREAQCGGSEPQRVVVGLVRSSDMEINVAYSRIVHTHTFTRLMCALDALFSLSVFLTVLYGCF